MQRKFLFIHQNFPGQFVHAASALARAGHEVVALGTTPRQLPGVRTLRYQVPPGRPRTGIALAQDLENQMLRGTACAQAMTQLRKGGFAPDLVVGHPGWGELLFCKDVWPRAPLCSPSSSTAPKARTTALTGSSPATRRSRARVCG
jgi:hypothetical protein